MFQTASKFRFHLCFSISIFFCFLESILIIQLLCYALQKVYMVCNEQWMQSITISIDTKTIIFIEYCSQDLKWTLLFALFSSLEQPPWSWWGKEIGVIHIDTSVPSSFASKEHQHGGCKEQEHVEFDWIVESFAMKRLFITRWVVNIDIITYSITQTIQTEKSLA